MSTWGHFSKDGKKYVLTRPDTPKPWVNVLSNGFYATTRSHLGDRISSQKSKRDHPNSCVYIHEVERAKVWSPNWRPISAPLQHFESTIGFGYTRIASRTWDCETTLTYFVPREDDCDITMLTVANHAKTKRTLRIYLYDTLDREAKHAQFEHHTLISDGERGISYLTANIPADGYEVLPENFFGSTKTAVPQMVERGVMPQNVHVAGESLSVLCFEVTLQAKETVEFDCIAGFAASKDAIQSMRKHYATRAAVQKALDGVYDYWKTIHESLAITTPDPVFENAILWSRYQAIQRPDGRGMLVTPPVQAKQADARGLNRRYYQALTPTTRSELISFNDRYIAVLSNLAYDCKQAERALQDMVSHQLTNGQCVATWDSYTKKGAVSESTLLGQWLASAVIAYIHETGNLKYLDTILPFYNGGRASVLEHCIVAMDACLAACSKRGILKTHSTRAESDNAYESSLLTMLTCYNLRALLPILESIGDHAQAKRYREHYHTLADALNAHAWDGKWYASGTNEHGEPLGSHRNAHDIINLATQAWSVISHVGDIDSKNLSGTRHQTHARGAHALAEAEKKLNTKYGPMLSAPPQKHADTVIDVTAAAWTVLAQCALQQGDEAYALWRTMSPQMRALQFNFGEEPYVYPALLAGFGAKNAGHAINDGGTEAAMWWHTIMIENILGVQASIHGLVLKPCVPKHWTKWSVTRNFRGARYEIEFTNPHHLSTGVQEIRFDKKICLGNVIPDFRDGKTHSIKVTLGSRPD